jgi:plasmid replication initiation protein
MVVVALWGYGMEATEDRGPDPQGRRGPARSPEGRDEFNLVEFPLTLLTDRAPRAQKTLEWEDEITDKATGLPVKRRVIVTGSDAYGLPTAIDNDVLFALIQLTKRANDFTSRDVRFSRYELLRLLNWGLEGKNYRRLDASFNRWLGTSIYFSAWRDKETETWESHKFHVLDNVSLISPDNRRILRAKGQPELATSSFTWNKVVFRNLQAGFVCPVDLETYFRLRSAISKRMLRYLGKHFRLRQQRALTFDLRTFAFEKIGLSRSYRDTGQIKKELQPALEELEGIGFLEPRSRPERYTRAAHGAWTIALVRTSDEAQAPGQGPPASRDASPGGRRGSRPPSSPGG